MNISHPRPITIRPVFTDKRRYLDLLLLADEQESMVDRYLDRGDLYLLSYGNEARAVCVVTRESEETCELKNLAVQPDYQRHGYGRMLIEYVILRYAASCHTLWVGTGESPLTLPFYEHCGFRYSHRIPDFFTHHYDHPIFEMGHPLTDMVYLKSDLRSAVAIDCAADSEHSQLIAIWSNAVRATHDFLSDADFHFYRSRMPFYLRQVALYVCRLMPFGKPVGFLGMSGDRVEMLFVDSAFHGAGVGQRLLSHAIRHLGARRIDVNEQNEQATGFYIHMGFRIVGHSPIDGEGRPYPLLHLVYERE